MDVAPRDLGGVLSYLAIDAAVGRSLALAAAVFLFAMTAIAFAWAFG